MEKKKDSKADLRKWSGTLLNFGIVGSLSLVLVAFEWKQLENKNLVISEVNQDAWQQMDPPITIHVLPPPPAAQPEIIIKPDEVIIDDDMNVKFDINTSENIDIAPVELTSPPMIDVPDEIKNFVDVQASFKGGMNAWYNYLKKNLRYPSQARRMGIEGIVIVRFVVNTDGSIQDLELLRTIGGGADQEALDVIKDSPTWIPGKMAGRPVRSRMTMPIRFRLN